MSRRLEDVDVLRERINAVSRLVDAVQEQQKGNGALIAGALEEHHRVYFRPLSRSRRSKLDRIVMAMMATDDRWVAVDVLCEHIRSRGFQKAIRDWISRMILAERRDAADRLLVTLEHGGDIYCSKKVAALWRLGAQR